MLCLLGKVTSICCHGNVVHLCCHGNATHTGYDVEVEYGRRDIDHITIIGPLNNVNEVC